MSRLDDELRLIYGRKEPSHDFTDRVMERIARESMAGESRPRARWWQQFAEMFTVPKVRWVAAGFAATLVVAVLAAQYARTPQVAGEPGGPITANNGAANNGAASSASREAVVTAPPQKLQVNVKQPQPVAAKKNPRAPRSIRERQKPSIKDESLIAAGEAAKQRLMLALQIASSTLGEAQRIIHDDSARSVPVSNR